MNGTTGHQIKATEFSNVEVTGYYDKSGFRVVVEVFAPTVASLRLEKELETSKRVNSSENILLPKRRENYVKDSRFLNGKCIYGKDPVIKQQLMKQERNVLTPL